jgi:hypothetical protein
LQQNGQAMKSRPRVITEFKNMRTLPSGYQVTVTRNKREFSKHFAGHSEKALKAAKRWRNLILRVLPNKRRKPIPKKILAAVGLKVPAVGVFRYAKRRLYYVSYRDHKRVVRSRAFPWSDRDGEIAAYAAAARFRKKAARSKTQRNQSRRKKK